MPPKATTDATETPVETADAPAVRFISSNDEPSAYMFGPYFPNRPEFGSRKLLWEVPAWDADNMSGHYFVVSGRLIRQKD